MENTAGRHQNVSNGRNRSNDFDAEEMLQKPESPRKQIQLSQSRNIICQSAGKGEYKSMSSEILQMMRDKSYNNGHESVQNSPRKFAINSGPRPMGQVQKQQSGGIKLQAVKDDGF